MNVLPRIAYLQPPSELLVQQETRELRGAGALQKLHKDLPQRPLELISRSLELRVPHKVRLVVICLELRGQRLEFRLVQVLVDLHIEQLLHLIEISSVEPGSKERLIDLLHTTLLALSLRSCGHGNPSAIRGAK